VYYESNEQFTHTRDGVVVEDRSRHKRVSSSEPDARAADFARPEQTELGTRQTVAAKYDREDCVEWAYRNYSRSYTSSDARNAAHKACDLIDDLASAKVLYEAYSRSWTHADAMSGAAKQATSALAGRAKILAYAIANFSRSWTAADAATRAATLTSEVPATALRCLKSEYDAYARSLTSADAMLKAFERCRE
jgi:hypothetical protein